MASSPMIQSTVGSVCRPDTLMMEEVSREERIRLSCSSIYTRLLR